MVSRLERDTRFMWFDLRGSEVLNRSECLRLLALSAKQGKVGRLAISGRGSPIVHPVNFSYRDGEIFVLLGEGIMERTATGALVAFETDCLDPRAGKAWSVLVRGLATAIPQGGSRVPAQVIPRPVVPVPGRQVLAIRPDVVTGRRFQVREEVVSPTGAAAVTGAEPDEESGKLV